MKKLTPWLAGLFVLLLRLTCRFRYHNDPRQLLNRDGINHLVAGLHAVQIAGVLGAERGVGTMVSRSGDGELIVPARCESSVMCHFVAAAEHRTKGVSMPFRY